jgi:hypothetical protein
VTLLIIGGLLIVALLAILGAVFFSVSDQRASRAQHTVEVSQSSSSASPMITQKLAEKSRVEPSTPIGQSMPVATERSFDSTAVQQQPYTLNGQFHELTVELKTLYQHAWELERRLRTLAEVANRIENKQSNQAGTEEEMRPQASADSTIA